MTTRINQSIIPARCSALPLRSGVHRARPRWATLAILVAIGCLTATASLADHHEKPAEPTTDSSAEAPAEPAATATPTPAEPQPVATPVSSEEGRVATPNVALARFTTSVENMEPVDAVTFLTSEQTRILFFTDLRELDGTTVTHRWEFGGNVMAEVPFDVRGRRWRVWSSKKLRPDWIGNWTVSVVKQDGEVLAAESFTYQEQP